MTYRNGIIGAGVVLCTASCLMAQSGGFEEQKLLADDPYVAGLGYAVAVSGDVVCAGAPYSDEHGLASGAAYIFNPDGTLLHHLTPGDATARDQFGQSVAFSGPYVLVGATQSEQNGDRTGAAYVFDAASGFELWQLEPSDGAPNASFGYSVALRGTLAVIGAVNDDDHGRGTGAVYVFDVATGAELRKIVPAELESIDNFGGAVSFDGVLAVVGATGDDDTAFDSGAAYVVNTTTGAVVTKLRAEGGESYDFFGCSVAIDGPLAAVGASSANPSGNNSGAVYLFDAQTGQQRSRIEPDDTAPGHRFGSAVALRGDRLLAGAYGHLENGTYSGALYLFDITDPENPVQLAKFTPEGLEGGDYCGWSCAMSDSVYVAGAYGDDDSGAESGAVYVYTEAKDSDGDGLLDDWEINGIPFTAANGDERRYILDVDGDGVSDADPMHKDLFVEIDMMTGLTFPQASVDMVVDAFWGAPVSNPDNNEGIDLHILVDESTIQFEQVSPTPGSGWPANASEIKTLYYGTLVEQSDPDEQALLAAKAKAYRYCILYNSASTDIGGLGELGGDDFVIFAGGYADEDKAAIFMHELGHNLNLRHGGSDSVNMKPNYPSIMNYAHTYRGTWNNTTWRLDYSRERLATINEGNLDEPVSFGLGGSGYYSEFLVPYYGVLPEETCLPGEAGTPRVSFALLDPASGGQDLDLDCDRDDTELEVDLNHLDDSDLPGTGTPSPGEVLVGHDDWANIVLPVSDGGGAFAGTAPTDELTNAQREWIDENFPRPCTADWNVDGVVNTLDFLAYLNDWTAGKGAADLNADGVVNTQDFLVFLNEWVAGC